MIKQIPHARIAIGVGAVCIGVAANASLTLTINNYTEDELSFTISGTFDSATEGPYPGYLALKNNWSGNIGASTELFAGEPAITLNTITIGGSAPQATSVQNGTFAHQDCVYTTTSDVSVPISAGTVVQGSMTLSLVGGFGPADAATLELVSGYSTLTCDWFRKEAGTTSEPQEPEPTANVVITNLTAVQLPGTKTMQIDYGIISSDTNTMAVSLTVSNGSSTVTATSLTGNSSTNEVPEEGKSILWDMGTDWNGNVSDLLYIVSVGPGEVTFPTYVPKTGQTNSVAAGDDGELQTGLEWPENRFMRTADYTLVDRLTGLEWPDWPQDAISENSLAKTIRSAAKVCDDLEYAGHDDWRLPNVRELESLLNYGVTNPATWLHANGLHGLEEADYWSSTMYYDDYWDNKQFYAAHMGSGGIELASSGSSCYVLPVRSSSSVVAIAPVPKTGQTPHDDYTDADYDGDLKEGLSWPSPRFSSTGNSTVIDNLTGQEWTQSRPSEIVSWSNAIAYCDAIGIGGYKDWRLPTCKELLSLVSYQDKSSYWSPMLPSGHPFGTVDVLERYYWSGTSDQNYSDRRWVVNMVAGEVENHHDRWNYSDCYVWAVRNSDRLNLVGTEISYTNATVCASSDSRDYALEIIAEHGAATPAAGIHSDYCWHSSVTCVVVETQSGDLLFSGWSGAATTDCRQASAIVRMDTPQKSLTANFSADADGDGLLNTIETANGCDPLRDDSAVLDYVKDNPDAVGLSGGASAPSVVAVAPADESLVASAAISIDLTFSETVTGVDATDLVLSGAASGSAVVATPLNLSGNLWRYRVSGLAPGALSLSLAPDTNDIEDSDGNDLANETWSYTVVTDLPAGSLDSPAGTTSTNSAMYTLDDLYNRLDTGAAGSVRAFAEPSFGPTARTMHNLNEIMGKMPSQSTNAAAPSNVDSGKWFWGLRDGQWGPQQGTRE